MTILQQALKWLRPGYKAKDDAEAAEEAAFRKEAGEIWLAYHENALWAQRKLDAGLHLTPEALEYMEREIESRKLADAARKANLETENEQRPETAAPLRSEQPASAGVHEGSGAGGLQEGRGSVDSSQPQGS